MTVRLMPWGRSNLRHFLGEPARISPTPWTVGGRRESTRSLELRSTLTRRLLTAGLDGEGGVCRLVCLIVDFLSVGFWSRKRGDERPDGVLVEVVEVAGRMVFTLLRL